MYKYPNIILQYFYQIPYCLMKKNTEIVIRV